MLRLESGVVRAGFQQASRGRGTLQILIFPPPPVVASLDMYLGTSERGRARGHGMSRHQEHDL